MDLTYRDLAEHYGVKLCQGNWYGEVGTPEPDHVRGWAERTTVHWYPDRRVTRAGLRRFLMLVAATRILKFKTLNPAMQLFAANRWAASEAATLHVRIPRKYSEPDRRRVRWLITRGQTVAPDARRWANRIQEGT